jgi:hypothetical protein
MTWPSVSAWSGVGVGRAWTAGMARRRRVLRGLNAVGWAVIELLRAPARLLDPLHDLAVHRYAAGELSQAELLAVVARLCRWQTALSSLGDLALWLARPGRTA